MFRSIGMYVTNTPLRNIFINLIPLASMGTSLVHFVFLMYEDTPEFPENEYESQFMMGGK
jgi:hypothetical protein